MTRLRATAIACLGIISLVGAGCGGNPSAPTSPQGPLAGLTSLTLTGNTSFAGVGETSKLTATGHFADGSTRDVSANVVWFIDVPGVVTITKGGLLTAIGLGVTNVFVSQPVFQKLRLTVTPPGTTAVGGWAFEPGVGDLGGVLVTDTSSGLSVVTELSGENQGAFALGGLTNGHLTLTKDSYEDARLDVTSNDVVAVPLQRIIRIAAGDSVSNQITPDDMDYLIAPDTHCHPCKLIRVTSAAATLRIHLTWSDNTSLFSVWINGQEFPGNAATLDLAAEAPASPGETLVYVTRSPAARLDNNAVFMFATGR